MSYKDITPGDKLGNAVGARVIKSSKGTVGIEVSFDFTEQSTGGPERLSWVGWLSANAMEHTMDTLVNVLGYNGSETTNSEGIFTDPQVIDFKKEVKLVVEMEENPNNGKSYPKIKWVNNVGGSAFSGVSPEVVRSELAGLGFKAAFLASQKKSGKTNTKQEDVPF